MVLRWWCGFGDVVVVVVVVVVMVVVAVCFHSVGSWCVLYKWCYVLC